MRVGITYNLKSGQAPLPGQPDDFEAEFDSETTIGAIERALQTPGHEVVRIGDLRDLVEFIARKQTIDIVFNLAEGWHGRARESEIPMLLEAFNIPHTMSDPVCLALSLDKILSKQQWCEAGLSTAPFTVVQPSAFEAEADPYQHIPNTFPLFVKPAQEGSSKGIDQGSVVKDFEALRARVEYLIDTYHQPVLIETFLPGSEFTVAVVGNGSTAQVLGIAEITAVRMFPVNGFEQKEHMKNRPDVFVPLAQSDPRYREMHDLALAAFHSLNCWDVARVDLRYDSKGRANLIEINPIAGLHPLNSALPAIARFAGMEYPELIQLILAQAITRYRLNRV